MRNCFKALVIAGLACVALLAPEAPGSKAPGRLPEAGAVILPPDQAEATRPSRITSVSGKWLAYTDFSGGTVHILRKSDLSAIARFKVDGTPLSIAWDLGSFFIGNEAKRRIEVYSAAGKFSRYFREPVGSPRDMAIDPATKLLYVIDGEEGTVKIFDRRGRFYGRLPGADGLVNPTGIALDASRKELFISDYGDPADGIPASIKVYGSGGVFKFGISSDDLPRQYKFSRPQGLAVDRNNGNILLTDAMTAMVLVIDENSRQVMKSLGGFGKEPGKLALPLDIVLDNGNGDIFITNYLNGRVEVFRAGGLVP